VFLIVVLQANLEREVGASGERAAVELLAALLVHSLKAAMLLRNGLAAPKASRSVVSSNGEIRRTFPRKETQ